jgi:hypothetical protein
MNSISSSTSAAARAPIDASPDDGTFSLSAGMRPYDLRNDEIHLRTLDGEFAAPGTVDGFDSTQSPCDRDIFEANGGRRELAKPDAQTPDPNRPLEFAVVPVLVAAGEAVVTLAAGVVASLIANEITKKVHETNQTKPAPTPPQPPPTGPANPQAGIIITPLPSPT